MVSGHAYIQKHLTPSVEEISSKVGLGKADSQAPLPTNQKYMDYWGNLV